MWVALGAALFNQILFSLFLGIGTGVFLFIAVMPIAGVSVNIISLFAFILVLGILVDNAIVVGENVYVRRASEPDGLLAAAIHDPCRGETFHAARGGGALLFFSDALFSSGRAGAIFLPRLPGSVGILRSVAIMSCMIFMQICPGLIKRAANIIGKR